MAGVNTQIFIQDFTATDTVVVNHNLDKFSFVIRVLVDNTSRPDLVQNVILSPTAPRDTLTVVLTQPSTGRIQLLDSDIFPSNLTEPEKVVSVQVSNLEATSDPTVNDDSDDGYGVGSFWINVTSGDRFLCVDPTPGAAVWTVIGDVLTSGLTATGFMAASVAGGTVVNATPVDIPLDTEVTNTGQFSFTPGGTTVTYTGPSALCFYHAHVSVGVSGSNSRSQYRTRLLVSRGGAPFVEAEAGGGQIYGRTSNYGGNSAVAGLVLFNPGDIYKIDCARIAGTAPAPVEPNSTGLTIFSLQGPQGPQGVPGSGVTIQVEDSGASQGAFETLNAVEGLAVTPNGTTFDLSTTYQGRSFSGYLSTNVAIGSIGITVLNADVELSPRDTSAYTWAPGGQVTIEQDGLYLVDCELSADTLTNVDTTRVNVVLLVGAVAVTGTRSFADVEPGGFTPANHVSTKAILSLSQGQTLGFGSFLSSVGGGALSAVDAVAEHTRINIVQIKRL